MIGDKIKELRIEKGITQCELASILQVSNKTISHWESNYSEPPLQMVVRIRDVFCVSYEELLD